MDNMQDIKIKGYYNKWSAIDYMTVNNIEYYLMENNTYGDETCYLVITKDQSKIFETFDDIETCLKDEEII